MQHVMNMIDQRTTYCILKQAKHQLTNGISSCFLSDRSWRTNECKESELSCNLKHEITLFGVLWHTKAIIPTIGALSIQTIWLSSIPRSPSEFWSIGELSNDFSTVDEFLESEFINRPEFFLTMGLPAEGKGFELPLNFQTPFPPPSFQSL